MKKTALLSVAAVAVLSASGTNEAFVAGKASGQIRAAYVTNEVDAGGSNYATSLGGILKYESADWNGLKLGVGAYISQKMNFASGENTHQNSELFDEDGKSYVYLGEAYATYAMDGLNLNVGRQQLDTPFADTDDIRMHPNTFEGAIATYSGLEGTTLVGGYVTRWAGYDSGDAKSTFKRFDADTTNVSNGVLVLGVINESVENLALQGWYYDVDEVTKAFYSDATYTIPMGEKMGVEFTAQYATFSEVNTNGVDGNVYGIGAAYTAGALTLGVAYNQADKVVINGFGGGPYMTSMEEWTIDAMEDAKAYQLSVGVDMKGFSMEGVTLTALYGSFESNPADVKLTEYDLITTMEFSDTLSGEISYAMIDDKNNNADGGGDAGYDRFLVRLNYNF